MIELLEKLQDINEEEQHDKWVVFDFDGVCSSYTKGWQGPDVFGDPVPGVADLISELRRDGFKVSLFTTRSITPALKDWLKRNRFQFDSINDTSHNPEDAGDDKPIAELYVDDRAVRFDEDDVEASAEEIRQKLKANESLMVCGSGKAILDEAEERFEDQFKPVSEEELERRVSQMTTSELRDEVVDAVDSSDYPDVRFEDLFGSDLVEWGAEEIRDAFDDTDYNTVEEFYDKIVGGNLVEDAVGIRTRDELIDAMIRILKEE